MKTGFHLPIYREQDLFAGSGHLHRSTLLNIAAAAGNLLPGFIAYLRTVVLRCGSLGPTTQRSRCCCRSFFRRLSRTTSSPSGSMTCSSRLAITGIRA